MKNMNNIDELFKGGLHQDFPYDEKLWAKVEGSLPNAPMKKSFWNFRLNAIILSLVLAGYAFMQIDNTESTEVLAQNALIETSQEPQEPTHTMASSTMDSDHESASMLETQEEFEAIAEEGSPSTPMVTHQNIAAVEKPQSEAKATAFEESSSIPQSEAKPAEIMTKDASAADENDQSIKPSNLLASTNDLIAFEDQMNDKLAAVEAEVALSTDEASLDLEFMQLAPYRIDTEISEAEPAKGLTPKSFPKKRQYYIEVLAASSFQIDKSTKSTQENFVRFKEKSETALHARNLGVNFLTNYRFLTLGVGAHFNQLTESVDYSNSSLVNTNLKSENTFNRIRIPISLSYEKSFGALSAGVGTGFVVNHIFQQKGHYINQNLDAIYDLNSGEEEFFLLVFAHQLSGSIGYSLNEYLAVGAKIYYEYDLNSYTKDYESKFQSQNLGVWLRIRPK